MRTRSFAPKLLTLCAATAVAVRALAGPATISVQVDQPGHAVSPLLWGLFFEDINLSADGGLYPELVRNRSFEASDELRYWKLLPAAQSRTGILPVDGAPRRQHGLEVHATTRAGSPFHAGAAPILSIDESRPLNAFNRRSLHVRSEGGCTLENGGYWGMNFVAGDSYRFNVAARSGGDFSGALTVQLCTAAGEVIASGEISGLGDEWKQHSLTLTPSRSDPRGKLRLVLPGDSSVFFDMISLLPEKTWKEHGLRVDLAEAMDALKPAFFRFPGGCWVEGEDMARAYQWKHTIGDVAARTPLENIWDYNATHGIGYHEYLQLAEDLGAEPLFCINVGMSHTESVPLDRMGAWIQDALDAIEYANGPVDSVWGSLRAKNGHPEPFNLRFVEIGNENGGPDYAERWPLFVKAIQAKYPDITLIANHWAGGYPKDPMPDIVDEHYYESAEAFMRRATMYDTYDRAGPKIFVGEYAVTRNAGQGNLRAALGEAAFMTGLERNSDIVVMAAYAPLFTNVNHRAWNPDLINFDSASWYGLPGYYVQQLFSLHRGDVTLPIDVRCEDVLPPEPQGRIGVGTWNTQAEFKDIKVTAPDGRVLVASDFTHGSEGWRFLGPGDWSVQDGALRQMAEKPRVRAVIGDASWKDYTIELKARKLGGREGFLILFHHQHDEDRSWWNIAGWDNSHYALDLDTTAERKPGTIETGRWYDVRLQVEGDHFRCWLDGQLIHDLHRPLLPTRAIYASATQDKASGDVILKVVNTAASPTETTIDLRGVAQLPGRAQTFVLTSENPSDENSLAEPLKVSPRSEDVTFSGTIFTRSFPANSFTVLRIATKR